MALYPYEILNAVVEESSFIRASERLHMTPSAVSHAIASFEAQLGFPLFIRTKRGVTLTGEGIEIMPYVRNLLSSEDALTQKSQQILGLDTGTVRIGAFNSVAAHWLPNIFSLFHAKYPNIDIQIIEGSYEYIVSCHRSRKIDIGFASKIVVPENLYSIELYKDRLVCVTPRDYVPPHKTYITVEDLRNEKLIMQQAGYDADTMHLLSVNNISAKYNFAIENDNTMMAMVSHGFGICIMTPLIVKDMPFDLNVYPIEPEAYRTIVMTLTNPEFSSPAVFNMKAEIVNYLEANGYCNV